MKLIRRISAMIIFVFLLLQIGVLNCYSQESEFIIKLKNGAEIRTKHYLIEEDIVYYRFYGRKNIFGVNRNDVLKIVEHMGSIELDPAPSKIPSKTVKAIAKGIGKDIDIKKDLAKYGYVLIKEKESEKYKTMYTIERVEEYPDKKGKDWVVVVEGIIRKNEDYPEKQSFPIVAQFEDENKKVVMERILLPANVVKEMEQGDQKDFKANIPLHMKARKVIIKKDDYKSK